MNRVSLFVVVLLVVAYGVGCSGLHPFHARGHAYYMDSHRGSDEAAGDQLHPWRSLSRLAKVKLRPGDTVFFVAGSEFEGGFEMNRSGTKRAPLTLTVSGKGSAPRFTNPRSVELEGNAIRVNANYIVIDGLSFTKCPTNPTATSVKELGAIFLTTNANHCVVRNCEITESPIGITVYGQHNLVTRNSIHDNNQPIQPHWGPIGIVICASHNEVSYNRIENYCAPSNEYGHDGGAIEINDRSLPKEDIFIHHNFSRENQGFIEWVGHVKQDNFRIHHNVCIDYQSFLGLTGPCTNFRVDHNTVVRVLAHEEADSEDVVFWNYDSGGKYANTNINFQNNIFVYDGSRVEAVFSRGQFSHSHNLFYRLDAASIPKQPNRAAYERKYLGGGAVLGRGDKIGYPLFQDFAAGDFHLQPASPAIEAGANLGYLKDFDGNTLPIRGAPDIGAFEFVSPPPSNFSR